MSKFFTCPHCKADVPIKARACPQCGSDEKTGWSEQARYVHLLPYDGDSATSYSKSKWYKYLIVVIVVITISAYLAAQGFTMSLYVIPLIALIVGIAYYIAQKYSGTRWSQAERLYRKLLWQTGGDKNLAERLIQFERERNPNADRFQLVQNALSRWQRDRR